MVCGVSDSLAALFCVDCLVIANQNHGPIILLLGNCMVSGVDSLSCLAASCCMDCLAALVSIAVLLPDVHVSSNVRSREDPVLQ